MTFTWNDLATSPRWRGIISFARNWMEPLTSDHGIAPEELDEILLQKDLTLPLVVREWLLLATNWPHGGLSVWRHPKKILIHEGVVWIATETEGVMEWGIRLADFSMENPPVVVYSPDGIVEATSAFSEFVAAMALNDVLFDQEREEPVELDSELSRAALLHLIASCFGDVLSDGPMDAATVLVFFYPYDGPVYGRSRTSAGRELLQSLRC